MRNVCYQSLSLFFFSKKLLLSLATKNLKCIFVVLYTLTPVQLFKYPRDSVMPQQLTQDSVFTKSPKSLRKHCNGNLENPEKGEEDRVFPPLPWQWVPGSQKMQPVVGKVRTVLDLIVWGQGPGREVEAGNTTLLLLLPLHCSAHTGGGGCRKAFVCLQATGDTRAF